MSVGQLMYPLSQGRHDHGGGGTDVGEGAVIAPVAVARHVVCRLRYHSGKLRYSSSVWPEIFRIFNSTYQRCGTYFRCSEGASYVNNCYSLYLLTKPSQGLPNPGRACRVLSSVATATTMRILGRGGRESVPQSESLPSEISDIGCFHAVYASLLSQTHVAHEIMQVFPELASSIP